jgi:hypothetical protein
VIGIYGFPINSLYRQTYGLHARSQRVAIRIVPEQNPRHRFVLILNENGAMSMFPTQPFWMVGWIMVIGTWYTLSLKLHNYNRLFPQPPRAAFQYARSKSDS